MLMAVVAGKGATFRFVPTRPPEKGALRSLLKVKL